MKLHLSIACPALAGLTLLAAGCSQDTTRFPSLAKRPVEAMNFSEPPAAPETPVTGDPALDARIAALATRLTAATSGFDSDVAKVERAAQVRGAKTVGSDAWLYAQTGLATLDERRAETGAIVSDIAAAGSARAAALVPPYPALEALQARAEAEAARQGAAIERLQAALPSA